MPSPGINANARATRLLTHVAKQRSQPSPTLSNACAKSISEANTGDAKANHEPYRFCFVNPVHQTRDIHVSKPIRFGSKQS